MHAALFIEARIDAGVRCAIAMGVQDVCAGVTWVVGGRRERERNDQLSCGGVCVVGGGRFAVLEVDNGGNACLVVVLLSGSL